MKFLKVETLDTTIKADVQIVTLNRPESKNAFNPEMISEIQSFFTDGFSADSRLLVLQGAGDVFCAGADLHWMKSMVNYSFEENIEDSKKLWNMFAAIQNCPVPVVAIAHGAVFGGALGLLACCDYVFVEEKTRFCFSEVKLGLAPAVISGFISKKIPDAFYRPLMLSAEVFTSESARKMGLCHQIYNDQIALKDVVEKFTGNGIEAMRETKKLLNFLLDVADMEKNKEACTRVITERRMSGEGQKRLAHFLSKQV